MRVVLSICFTINCIFIFGAVNNFNALSEQSIELLLESGGNIELKEGHYILERQVTIKKPTKIIGTGNVTIDCSKIKGGAVISIESSNVKLYNLNLIGSATSQNANIYCIQTNSGVHENIILNGINFKNFGSLLNDIRVSQHAIYIQRTSSFRVINCTFSDVSGAAIFLKTVSKAKLSGNKISNTGWYSIQLYNDCKKVTIKNNNISGQNINARKFGGSIDLMSQHVPLAPPNSEIKIVGNTITGYHNYGGVIRMLSCNKIKVRRNVILQCKRASGEQFSLIRLGRRGDNTTNTYSSSCNNIKISSNRLTSYDDSQIAILMDNQYVSKHDPNTKVRVLNNNFAGVFRYHIILKYNKGGFENYNVARNTATIQAPDKGLVIIEKF